MAMIVESDSNQILTFLDDVESEALSTAGLAGLLSEDSMTVCSESHPFEKKSLIISVPIRWLRVFFTAPLIHLFTLVLMGTHGI